MSMAAMRMCYTGVKPGAGDDGPCYHGDSARSGRGDARAARAGLAAALTDARARRRRRARPSRARGVAPAAGSAARVVERVGGRRAGRARRATCAASPARSGRCAKSTSRSQVLDGDADAHGVARRDAAPCRRVRSRGAASARAAPARDAASRRSTTARSAPDAARATALGGSAIGTLARRSSRLGVVRRGARVERASAACSTLYAPERLHAVRIAVKKLRYALECRSEPLALTVAAARARAQAGAAALRHAARPADLLQLRRRRGGAPAPIGAARRAARS